MSKHTEDRFEEAIEASLITDGGYEVLNPKEFVADTGLFPFEVIEFLKSSQPKNCLLYTSPSPRDRTRSRMPSSA